MCSNIIVKLLFVINSLICISYAEVLSSRLCKPGGTIWTDDGTVYRSIFYRRELHAYAVCKIGYTLSSSSEVLCVNGFWENPLPRCERITSRQCKPLRSLKIVLSKCENEPPLEGSICRYRCPRNFSLIGSSERRCGQNLQWTGVEPRCILEYSHTTKANNPDTAFDYSRYNRRREKTCDINNGGCEQICNSSSGFPVCSCSNGFRLETGGKCQEIKANKPTPSFYYRLKTCDINNGGCEQICNSSSGFPVCSCKEGYRRLQDGRCKTGKMEDDMKSLGSAVCSCPPGFELKDDNKTCDYVLKIFTHLVTDSNAKSFIADCRCPPGFIGSPSHDIPCSDINECLKNNFGCSHICTNTPGSALCSCLPGVELKDDNKTCVDVDECQIKNGGCEMLCHNTIKSFYCSCSNGYTLAEDNYSCIDNDECADGNNGGCSDICNNFPGGHYCSCHKGFRLDIDGKTCFGARCLSVAVPHHSSLHCEVDNETKIISKSQDYSSQNPLHYPYGTICMVKCREGFKINDSYEVIKCLEDGSWNATAPQCVASHCPSLMIPDNGDVYPPTCKEDFIPVQQQCYFTCKPGYEMFGGKSMIKCSYNLTWIDDPPSCRPVYIPPTISCPDDITVELNLNENSSNISIPRPITNMEDVEIYPDWIRLEQPIPFPSGKTSILFTVRNADFNATSQCIMTINVLDKEPPMFVMCPESFNVSDVGYQGVLVTWDEPVATDNVAIQSVVKNLEPNSTLKAGVHFVEYTAKDAAGNSATCTFQINITRGHCKDLNDPENGKAVCMDWLMGKLCRPACNPGFSRDPDEPKFFACSDSGKWTPSNTISPCFPTCLNGQKWSTISQSCEEEAFIIQ
nr:fibrillin-2-like isoform X2 [Parasteatoda tepidariorum]